MSELRMDRDTYHEFRRLMIDFGKTRGGRLLRDFLVGRLVGTAPAKSSFAAARMEGERGLTRFILWLMSEEPAPDGEEERTQRGARRRS